MKNEVNLLNSDIRIPTLGSCYCLHLFIYPSMHAGEREKQEEFSKHTCYSIFSCPFGRMLLLILGAVEVVVA